MISEERYNLRDDLTIVWIESKVYAPSPNIAKFRCRLSMSRYQVVRHVLEVCTAGENKVDINKKLLLEIAEDHPQPEEVKEIISKICD